MPEFAKLKADIWYPWTLSSSLALLKGHPGWIEAHLSGLSFDQNFAWMKVAWRYFETFRLAKFFITKFDVTKYARDELWADSTVSSSSEILRAAADRRDGTGDEKRRASIIRFLQSIISGEIANFVSFSWVLPTAGVASRGQIFMHSWIWLFWLILEYFTIVFKNALVSAVFARAISLVALPDSLSY